MRPLFRNRDRHPAACTQCWRFPPICFHRHRDPCHSQMRPRYSASAWSCLHRWRPRSRFSLRLRPSWKNARSPGGCGLRKSLRCFAHGQPADRAAYFAQNEYKGSAGRKAEPRRHRLEFFRSACGAMSPAWPSTYWPQIAAQTPATPRHAPYSWHWPPLAGLGPRKLPA